MIITPNFINKKLKLIENLVFPNITKLTGSNAGIQI